MAAVVYVLLYLFTTLLVSNAKTYYMHDYCGQTLDVSTIGQVNLELTYTEYFSGDTGDCDVYFVTSSHQQLLFDIQDVDLDDCHSNDWLRVYEDSTMSSDAISAKLCKDENIEVTTRGNEGILKFHPFIPWISRRASFRLVISAYSTGYCGSEYFHCANNRCIKDDLKCDDNNDCGDEDDEENCTWPWWAFLIIGIVVFVVIVVSVAVICCIVNNMNNKKRIGQIHQTTHTGTTPAVSIQQNTWGYTTAITPSAPPPAYTFLSGTTTDQQGVADPPPVYTSTSQLPPLHTVPGPAIYNLPLSQKM